MTRSMVRGSFPQAESRTGLPRAPFEDLVPAPILRKEPVVGVREMNFLGSTHGSRPPGFRATRLSAARPVFSVARPVDGSYAWVSKSSQDYLEEECLSKFMTAQEAADYLRLNVQTIYNLIHQKRLTPLRIGKDIRFDQARLDEFMHRHTPMTLEEAALYAGLEPDAAFSREYRRVGAPVTLEKMDNWKMTMTDPRKGRIDGASPLTTQSLNERAEALANRVGGTVWRCPLCPPGKGYRVRCRCLACETPVCLACSRQDLAGPATVLGQSRMCRECVARREAPSAGSGPRSLAEEEEGGTDRLVRADRTGTPPEPGVTRGQIKTDLRRVTLYGDKA